jgi:hypothetical protein
MGAVSSVRRNRSSLCLRTSFFNTSLVEDLARQMTKEATTKLTTTVSTVPAPGKSKGWPTRRRAPVAALYAALITTDRKSESVRICHALNLDNL